MQNFEVKELPLSSIKPNEEQPRKVFDKIKIDELSESIKQVGLIQPIAVRRMGTTYEIISGERRYRACQLLNFESIPAVIYDVNDLGSAALALVENMQREDLSYIEEARAIAKLIKEHQLTQEQIAKLIGKSQSNIANKLRLLKHSGQVLTLLLESGLSERHARALLKVYDEEDKIAFIEKIKEQDLSVKRTEALIESFNSKTRAKRQKIKGLAINNIVYLNTIRKAYDELKKAGIESDYQVDEDDQEYIVTIKIKK